MENENKILIGEKEYTKEELLAFGKCHYPKFYWIPRGIGIGFMATGFITISFLILFFIFNKKFLEEHNIVGWYFWVEVIVFASIAIAGLVSYIVSFKKQPDENYIKHAVDYYTRVDERIKLRDKKIADRKERVETAQLLKYKKLRDAGAISEEEYENKKKEILGE